ncbi:SDR family oxidoreductase [Rhodococcus sp. USK10]|uniref:3-oxoacyl-[acyl-carrier protein] reductase n=2 Tax=Nocardiaceae TaxID=85025 RepID=A0A402CMV1_RHOWR|nr:SDR family oxidoreductase [Rhodococcus sp. USK10]GCE44829.1 3-oxoacyl-[acyl-carrier protein] reductase [Rhodococcus wratislaviensis]
MGQRVQGKVAIVTGAASGMGAADIRLLAEEGASVVAADVDKVRLDFQVAQLVEEGLSVTGVTLDVANPDDWASAVRTAEEIYGAVTVLVNNAGIHRTVGLEDTDQALWDQVIGINQTGVFYGMRAVVPSMRRAGGGSIVNIASIHGIVGTETATAYHASKGAVRSMTKQAACQYGREKIRVNSIDPGVIETQILVDARKHTDLEPMTQLIPLKRFGDAREIAHGVLFLASDEASFITGTDLVIDGGMIAIQ